MKKIFGIEWDEEKFAKNIKPEYFTPQFGKMVLKQLLDDWCKSIECQQNIIVEGKFKVTEITDKRVEGL